MIDNGLGLQQLRNLRSLTPILDKSNEKKQPHFRGGFILNSMSNLQLYTIGRQLRL